MKISKLIKALDELKKVHGDKEVFFSSDPEGNSFGSLGDILYYYESKKGGCYLPLQIVRSV